MSTNGMRILRAGLLVGLLLNAIGWLYVGLAPRYGATFATALRATTLLALVTFIPGAWLVHVLLRKHALA